MARKIFAIAIALAAGIVRADNCVGSTKQATTTGLTCTTAATTAAACPACCISDTTKCGANTVTCAASYFQDSAKAGNTAGADAAAMKNNCCTMKAKCSTYTCGTGYTAIAAAATTDCAGAACASSDAGTCCQADATKCGGNSVTCDSGYFQDSSKAAVTTAADAAAKQTNCCTAKAKCSSYTCAAGTKLITDAATTNCTTATCASADAATCCEADLTKCGAYTVTCAASYFQDSAKAGNANGTDAAAMKTNCCTAKAKCSTGTCTSPYVAIAAAATTDCATATCGTSDVGTCCIADTTKCGGNSITCATDSFLDSSKSTNTAGADATAMKSNCCTLKATCIAFQASGGLTSGASKHETVVMTLMFAMVGVVILIN